MLVKLNQQDGHVRTYEIRTISNDAEAAIAVADGMRNGESAEVCRTSYDLARGEFVNRVITVEVFNGEVYTVVDGERRYHGKQDNQ